jgi:molybdate transport system substrate-binding protein
MKRLLIFTFFWILLVSCSKPKDSTLSIAVSSNMQFAMEELIQAFEIQSGISCVMVVSSSGKLTAQIQAGSPMDVLVSADMKYPKELYRKGFTINQPATYAYGKLVLWTKADDFKPAIDALLIGPVKHIAIPNPKTAPYGFAALEILRYHELYDSLEHKLVYGESVSQINQFIISGSAEIGFTAKSVVVSPKMKTVGNWVEMDQDQYSLIKQGAVILKTGNIEKAKQFFTFLFSPEAKQILQKFGYSVPL